MRRPPAGPVSAAARIPDVVPLPSSFTASPLEALVQARQQHGDIFAARWLGARTVFFTGPVGEAAFFHAERGHMTVHNTRTVRDLFGRAIFNLSGADHAQARALLRSALAGPPLAAHAPRAVLLAEQHVAKWAAAPQVDAYKAARALTWDACAELILGLPAGSDAAAAALLDSFALGTVIAPTGRHLRPGYWRGFQARTRLREVIRRTADARAGAPPSVLRLLAVSAGQRGGDLSALPDHMLAILIAARETTASLITWMLVELAAPHTADGLASEAEAAEADPGALLDREGTPELRAMLLETERLHSPNPLSRRTVTSAFDAGGYHVPAGWRAAYSPAASHLMPDLYPDPLDFRPGRFRDGHGRTSNSLLTFGAGLHACPGKPFAEMLALSVAAAILRRHRVTLPAGAPARVRFWPVKVPAGPIPVSLRPA